MFSRYRSSTPKSVAVAAPGSAAMTHAPPPGSRRPRPAVLAGEAGRPDPPFADHRRHPLLDAHRDPLAVDLLVLLDLAVSAPEDRNGRDRRLGGGSRRRSRGHGGSRR